MTQTRPASGMSPIAALFLGGAAAFAVDAVLIFGQAFLIPHLLPHEWLMRVIGFGISLLVGLAAGGATLLARPSGPVVPLVVMPIAFVASIVGDVVGGMFYGFTRGHFDVFRVIVNYFESFRYYDALGWIILLLCPLAAGGIAAVRHLRSGGQAPRPQPMGGWAAPHGGQYPGGRPQGGQFPGGQFQPPPPHGGAVPPPGGAFPQPPMAQPPYGQPAQQPGQQP